MVEGQERNTAQLERIGATIEWRWSSKESLQGHREESEVKEDRDDKKGSKSEKNNIGI